MSYILLLLLFYNLHATLSDNTTNCYYSETYRTTCCLQHNSSSNSTSLYCPTTNPTSIGTLGPPAPYCTYYYSNGCCVRNVPTDYANPTARYTTEYFCPPKTGVSVCGSYCISMVVFAILGSLFCLIGCTTGVASLAIIVHILIKNNATSVYSINKARDRQNRYSRSGRDEEREIILEDIHPDVSTSSVPFQIINSFHSQNSTLPIQDLENEELYYDEAPSVVK